MQDVFHELEADPKLLDSMENFLKDLNEMWAESGVIYSDPPLVSEPRYVRPTSSVAAKIWDACGFRASEQYVTIEHGLTKWAENTHASYVGKDGNAWVTWTVDGIPCHARWPAFLKWFTCSTKVEST